MLYIVSIKVGFPVIHHCQTDVFPLIPKRQRCCHYFAVVAEVSVSACGWITHQPSFTQTASPRWQVISGSDPPTTCWRDVDVCDDVIWATLELSRWKVAEKSTLSTTGGNNRKQKRVGWVTQERDCFHTVAQTVGGGLGYSMYGRC